MNNQELLQFVKDRARVWLGSEFDKETRKQVQWMLDNDPKALIDAFYQDLEFGTGGLRGVMGAGTNRMNIYTVGMATQGLCNYLKKHFVKKSTIKVAIAYDSRNNSRLFAETASEIFSANNIKAYLFDDLRPTPELSFTIRHLDCQAGIVLTASHNPKEYNGYKVYWEDGGQIIAPHDKNIIEEVQKIRNIQEVDFNGKKELIEIIGKEIDEIYTDKILELSLSTKEIQQFNDLKIVYTPIHGAGVKLVPMILQKMGFTNVIHVPEQDESDGNFPTVHSPNPEETAALNMAMEKGKKENADLIMGTDPDTDRVGIIVKNREGQFLLLNGNQAASILIYYLLTKWNERGLLKGKEYIVKTIVTTELLTRIAEHYHVEHYHVLTGFKYIANIIHQFESTKTFIGGGEESYGYLAGEFVRDKDAVISCAMFAEIAAWAKSKNLTLFDILIDIYLKFGFYKENLVSVVMKGKEGADQIKKIMSDFRSSPPKSINNSKIVTIHDYLEQKSYDVETGNSSPISLPKSNVLQFLLQDGSKISLRPSGTEPKIKLYISVNDKLMDIKDYETLDQRMENRINNIITDLNIK